MEKERNRRSYNRYRAKRVTAFITYALMHEIDKYRAQHGMPTVSTAVEELLKRGLEK